MCSIPTLGAVTAQGSGLQLCWKHLSQMWTLGFLQLPKDSHGHGEQEQKCHMIVMWWFLKHSPKLQMPTTQHMGSLGSLLSSQIIRITDLHPLEGGAQQVTETQVMVQRMEQGQGHLNSLANLCTHP